MIYRSVLCLLLMSHVYTGMCITLDIPSYPEESVIPDDYTFNSGVNCNGANISPQVIWSDTPNNTESFALVFVDENFDFIHWKLYNIAPEVRHIPENNPNTVGTEGLTDFGIMGYGGPCPPSITPGNYRMTIYALNTTFTTEPTLTMIESAAIDSASYLAFRNLNDEQDRFEYTAQYKVTFFAEWSATSHPIDYPNSAHFSPLVGNTHNMSGGIWQDNGIASNGMEQMAETGGTSMLNIEIINSIDGGNSETLILGPDADGVDTIEMIIEISHSHPMFSMVTMIAPSPDWFIGVHDIDLKPNGVWLSDLSIDLFPYDAGTQDGSRFFPAGSNTSPREPIATITESPFPNGVRLGRFVFELQSVSGQLGDDVFSNGFE